MLQPDFKEFSQLAREATLIPVVKSVSADLLTPVSAFLAIAQKESHAFLLESIERGEQIGRYTFLGAAPYMRVKARKGRKRNGAPTRRRKHISGRETTLAGTSSRCRSGAASVYRRRSRVLRLR